jgi:Secretion system C-terminal sorting domain
MRKIALAIICVLGIIFSTDAQLISFIKTYGNTGYDFGKDIKQDTDTGYVVTGSSSSFVGAQSDVYLLKVDSLGNFKWSINHGGEGSDWGEAIEVTNDSTYAIGGYTNSFGEGGFDFYLLRLDQEGNEIWSKTYGGSNWDKAYGMVQTPDSGFVLVGESYSFNGSNQSGYVVRTDKWGDTLWTYVEENTNQSFFNDVTLDGDSIVICGGYYSSATSSVDGWIKTMHLDGNEGASKLVGQGNDDYFTCVYVEGGFYNFGGARAYNFDTEKTNMWNYRMQDDHTEVFDLAYINLSVESDQINDIVTRWYNQDTYFIGQTESYGYLLDGKDDIFMGKCSSGGVYFAANNYGAQGEDIGQSVDNCYDDGVVFLSDSKYFATGGNNIIIMKLNYTWSYPDLFGDISYDDITTSIDEENDSDHFYPNPLENLLNFGKVLNGQIQIYDLSGKLILNDAVNSSSINLEGLESGTYILTYVNAADKKVSRTKIIKN